MTQRRFATSTDAVHAGEPKAKAFDALPEPIVQTATYAFESIDELIEHHEGRHPEGERYEYGRYGNPTVRALEKRLAALEGTDDALFFASGMAAVTTAILALVKAGQHVVLFQDCYRRTRQFVTQTLGKFGVRATLIPPGDLRALEGALEPETRLVVSESPTNPYLACVDLEGMAAVCKRHGPVKTLVDATFATPINCRPAAFGVDLVIHSATKYLAGHNDVLAGAVAGPAPLVSLIRELRDVLGGVLDPHAAFLVGRGMKTLALRVERSNATSLELARFLAAHPGVEDVFYPGLPTHPSHAIAQKQMAGFGGVISFVVRGGLPAARAVVEAMKLARIAPSLGGVETLIEPPAVMSYHELGPEGRSRVGIQEGLVRLSVGIEDAADLKADLDRALAAARNV